MTPPNPTSNSDSGPMTTEPLSRFGEYVTSTAFSITLSRRMCQAMEFVMLNSLTSDGFRELSYLPHMPTLHSLERRGLVVDRPWRLTDAGVALYPLLEMARLVTPLKELRERCNLMRKIARGVA